MTRLPTRTAKRTRRSARQRPLGMLLIAAVVVLQAGCTVKLAYNNLDRLIRWQAADYVDMNADQRAYLNAAVKQVLYWHRTEELPRYAAFLDTLPPQLADQPTAAELQSLSSQFEAYFEPLEDRALPVFAELMLSLDDEQVAELPEKLAASNRELAEDELTGTVGQHREQWAEEVRSISKRLVGRLTQEQKAVIATASARYQPEMVLWAEYRQRWQADLLKLLDQRDNPDAFKQRVIELSKARESYWGEAFTEVSNANEQLVSETVAKLFAIGTAKQQAHLEDLLTGLAQDFRELAAAAPAQAPPLPPCLTLCGEDPG